jgi:hypothetical protein
MNKIERKGNKLTLHFKSIKRVKKVKTKKKIQTNNQFTEVFASVDREILNIWVTAKNVFKN